jgi:hypothetical protein
MIAVSESGGLIRSSGTAYINAKQRGLFDEEIPGSELRADNIPAGDEVLRGAIGDFHQHINCQIPSDIFGKYGEDSPTALRRGDSICFEE